MSKQDNEEVILTTATDICNVLKGTSSAIDVLAPFIPLINDVTKLIRSIAELYQTAQHNKKICRLLLERVRIVEFAIEDMITDKENLQQKEYYKNFTELLTVIRKIEKFIKKVSNVHGLRKFLNAYSIEDEFKNLTQDFDDLIRALNFATTLQIQSLLEKSKTIIKRDIADLEDYLRKIEGGITDINQKITEKFEVVLAMFGAYDKAKLPDSIIDSVKIDRHKLTDPETSEQITRGKYQKKYFTGKIEVAVETRALSSKPDEEKKNLMSRVAILKKLKNCPHIIQFYGVSEDENAILMVTGWAELGSLTEYYKNHGPLDWLKRSQIATDIVRGLTFLHEVSILHHDIRSQNILIDQYHAAKIANFALSRNYDDQTLAMGPTLANARYMAPEKLKDHETLYNTKCEIYSFGILLWEIAEEQIPYKSKGDLKEICEEALKIQSLPFSAGVPPDWQQISWGATRHEPSLRPSLTDMFTALHKLLKLYKPQVSPRSSLINTPNAPITLLTLDPNLPDTDNDDDFMIESDLAELSNVLSVQDAILEYKKKGGNKIDAFKAFEIHASFGDQLAKYWMGYYLFYDKLPQNPSQEKKDQREKAVKLFKEAADKGGIAEAQLRYAYCLWAGDGVQESKENAIKYYEVAANNDNPTAMYNVGYLYYRGSGVLKDEKKGKEYLILAALKGQPKAVEMCQKENISFTENLD
ncbi:hypothetical protein G9A89_010585 [Geosiphon pyriformis]|nr:hypothetical protein G9A89_010585 [Geosiphon pyriformis]